jgi:hypothetical protein
MIICALYPTPETIEPGSPVESLLQRFPTPAKHDGFNILFAQTIEELTNGAMSEPEHIVLEESFVDEEGAILEDDFLAWEMAKLLVRPDRPVIYGQLTNFSTLYNHPAYRLYCGRYESYDQQFTDDLAYMTNMISVGMPEALDDWADSIEGKTSEELKDIMLALITAYSAPSP